MIPRTLVPPDARPAKLIATPGRSSALDERTLVPGHYSAGPLETATKIPANLPLESIAARTLVPRDVNPEAYQPAQPSAIPVQPTTLDERIAVPGGFTPLEVATAPFALPVELVEGDVFTTGEVQLLVNPITDGQKEKWKFLTRIASGFAHALLIALIIWQPKLFQRRPPTAEDQEIARRQLTLLLPPGAFDIPAPVRPPQPRIHVNPDVLRKVAPPALPAPIPQPVQPQPKQDLPNAPTPQLNASQPPPQPEPKTEIASNMPLKLEKPDTPKPQPGLVLPKFGNTRPSDAAPQRQAPGISGPRATIQNVPVPRSLGGGHSGEAAAGMRMLTPDQGVDFTVYLARVRASIERNWQAVMPESVSLGERGKVVLVFRIMKDGSVPQGYPQMVRTSSKEPLDRAAVSSIRASNPFEPLPPAFSGPYIDLLVTYLYNLPLEAANEP